ncbi:MAG: LamG-like jellyroll fold domain-containing protein [Bacteroidota bacterium]|nr:LamG-like jellyroll fold domain-containing protein [Bacteroidota bacterium]
MKRKNLLLKAKLFAIGAFAFSQSHAQTTTFNYTGGLQTYTVPAGVTSISVDVKGAQGGFGYNCPAAIPGLGGRVQCTLAVTPGQVLNIYVGGQGVAGTASAGGAGGYNGGGLGGTWSGGRCGGGGGGASDIRQGGTALANRVVVGAGGGGTGVNHSTGDAGGNGGGLTGTNGLTGAYLGGGATQLAGGTPNGASGVGGPGGTGQTGGGGGGGYYGGGGSPWEGGGGGSSFTNSTVVSSVVHTAGFQSGNGEILITPLIFAAAALNFDGVDDAVNTGTNISTALVGLNKITAEAWVKPSTTTGPFRIVVGNYSNPGNSMHFCIRQQGSNYVFFIGSGSTGVYSQVNAINTVTTGIWQHLAGTWDGSVAKIYINGILNNTLSITYPSFGVLTNSVIIGNNSVPEPWSGDIDEVRIWNTARTQCEINTYKNCEIPTTATGLIANYHFNQGLSGTANPTVTTLVDNSGNSFTGSLNNFTLTGSISNWVAPGGVVSNFTTAAVLNPTVNSTVTNSVICNGNSTTLNGTGANTYVWTSGVTNGVAFTPSTTTSYTVTGTATLTGCTNTAVNTVTVNASPTVSVNSGAICPGASFTIMPSGASTYTISGGSSVVTPTANSSYSVTGTSSLGCVSSNTAVSSVTISALPTVSVNSGGICPGNSFTIVPSGATTYTISGGSSVVTPTANSSYSVTGTNSLGCVSSNTAVSSVSINPLPTVSVNSGVICSGSSFTIVPSGASTYSISGGSSVVTPTSNASYSVTGTNSLGCVSSNTAVSSVSVNALPTINAVSNSSLLCVGQTASLTASGAATYTWNTSANTSVIAISPSVTTTYTVNGTNANGCSNVATVTQSVSACTGIQSTIANQQLAITVYPNPSNGIYTIEVPSFMNITIVDVLGKVVYSQQLQDGKYAINLTNLNNGLYILKAESNGAVKTTRLIKE